MNSATNISPQRPVVPPKPDKDKISTTSPVGKSSSGTQVNFHGKASESRTTTQNGQNLKETQGVEKSRSVPSVPPVSVGHRNGPSGPSQGPKSPLINSPQNSLVSPLKPALPPKPASNSIPSPPKKSVTSPNQNQKPPHGASQIFPRSGNSVSIANSILANRGRHSLDGHGVNINSQPTSPRNAVNECLSEPESLTTVVRREPGINVGSRSFNKSTSEPLSPRPTFNNNPRPFSSVFTFPSPEANANSPGFSSTILKRHAEIRAKSASLGRNVTPPTSTGGFFSNKAVTLSRILPLDLHFGKFSSKSKSPSMQQTPTSPTSPKSPTSPIQNFGRKISFSTNSPIPPPPPPRLRKKLSPVNSLSPVESVSPTSPVFSPPSLNPFMTSVQEEPAIYAEIDKEKKWAQRKLKQEIEQNDLPKSVYDLNSSWNSIEQTTKDIQASLVISINQEDKDRALNFQSHAVKPDDTKMSNNNNNNISSQPTGCKSEESKRMSQEMKSAEDIIVDSWLGKYLPNPIVSQTNPLITESKLSSVEGNKSTSIDVTESKTSDQSPKMNSASGIIDVLEGSNVSVEKRESLVENDSFLFKLNYPLNGNSEQSSDKSHETDPQISSVTSRDQADSKLDSQVSSVVEAMKLNEQSTTTSNFPAVNNSEILNATVPNPDHSSVTEAKENESAVIKESSNVMKDEIPDPDTILHSVDAKIQSAVSLLSNLSGTSSPVPNRDLIPTTVSLCVAEEFESLSISEVDLSKSPQLENNGSFLYNQTTAHSDIALSTTTPGTEARQSVKELAELLSPTESTFLRRRSWNCSESSSPCESSSSSLSNIRERAFTYSSSKGIPGPGWVDEGELSTGALADAESSDAHVPSSSTEDMGGSISRRKRLWIFSSFGKGGSSSSSSNGNQKSKHHRQKEKIRSLAPDANGKSGTLGRFGRQVSDSVLSTVQISGPVSQPDDASQQPKSSQSHPSVQFSPEVDTPIYRYRYSEGSISETGELAGLSQSGEHEKGDCESISSAGSANAVLGGYEDILADLSPKDRKSFYVAREILTSEQTFVDVLDLLTVEFPNAIHHAEKLHHQAIIPPHDIDKILSDLPNLKTVNKEILVDLQNRIKNWKDQPKLADIIVKKGPFLKLYATYIKNFEKTTQHLDDCRKDYPLFAKALLDFEMSDRCQKLGLKHYMLKPVQRMPQYRLLLEDYLKHLEEGSSDYEDSIKAIAIVRDVAEHANEAIRLQVNAEKLLLLQDRLIGAVMIMKADRQLMKEGELMKVCRKGLQPRFFALMNDCLMCMTYNVGGGTDLKLRYELPLAGMRICLTAIEDHPNEFSVISVARSFNLVAKSPREREDWMKALNNAIHYNIKKRTCTTPDQEIGFQLGKIAPVWIQDSRVTMCQVCTAEFTVTFRRHHCRACGKVICGHCSGNQAPLQYLKNDAARVCDECYQFLLEEFDKESREHNSDGLETSRDTIRIRFKKDTPNVSKRAAKVRRTIPSRLEVHANNSGSRISNYLHWRERKAWKRHWFVLMDRVLYIYAASEDIVAVRSIPVLGYKVDYEKSECMEGGDREAVFKLTHQGANTLLFQAENPALAERWVAAMKEATVLT